MDSRRHQSTVDRCNRASTPAGRESFYRGHQKGEAVKKTQLNKWFANHVELVGPKSKKVKTALEKAVAKRYAAARPNKGKAKP